MQLKTSTSISVKFTLFTILIVVFFGILANIIFFRNWYISNMAKVSHPMPHMQQQKMFLGRQRPASVEKYSLSSTAGQTLQQNVIWRNISKIQDQYFLFYTVRDQVFVSIVTHPVLLQIQLLKITLFLVLFFGILAYLLSLLFIKTSLKSLFILVEYAQNLHLDNLDTPVDISGPDDDEIKILAETLNLSLKKLHQQTDALKDFVAHASHELKTPLMAMSTQLDVAIKKKNISSIESAKTYIKHMNLLIEKLLLITRLENKAFLSKKDKDIYPIVSNVIKNISEVYKDKNLHREVVLPKLYKAEIDESYFVMLIQNIIDNAAKYTDIGGKIFIEIQQNMLIVKDTGKGIEEKVLRRIWEKFWQLDTSKNDKKSFGLGLYLVKKLVDLHGREIEVESEKGKGTMFVIEMQ